MSAMGGAIGGLAKWGLDPSLCPYGVGGPNEWGSDPAYEVGEPSRSHDGCLATPAAVPVRQTRSALNGGSTHGNLEEYRYRTRSE